MTGRLHGKIAVITGAASGIGKATAELFVAAGANAVAADIDDQNGAARQAVHQALRPFRSRNGGSAG